MNDGDGEQRRLCESCGARLDYEKDGLSLSHEVGVVQPGVYDGVLYWQCPFCGGIRHCWPEGSELRSRTERFLAGGPSQ